MNAPKFWMVVPALLVAGMVGLAYAKLPPPSEEAKAAAAAAKGKAGEAAKKDAEALTKAQDRAVDHYKKSKGIKTATAAPGKKK
jgi:hypothetical protein